MKHGIFSFLTLCGFVAAFCAGHAKADDPPAFVPPMTPELKAGLAYCQEHGIPVFDMHIHLRGGMTAEKAAIRQELTGIRSGVLENHGRDWPLSDDSKLRAFIADARKHPVLVGIQVNDRDWYKTIAPEVLMQLDFVLADTMIMGVNAEGKPQKLWINNYEIPDPEAWMEEYMAHNLRILDEPISILANPTYLPAQIAHLYDELWTDERMETIIKKAVENSVALEIQAEAANTNFSKKRFFTLAKKHGAMISLGTNNFDDKPIPMDVCFRLVEELELKPRAWQRGQYKLKEVWEPRPKFRVYGCGACIQFYTETTDADLADLAKYPELMELSLSNCRQISDAGLAHLKHVKKLRKLNLTACEQLTDAALAHLADLTELEELSLYSCPLLTDAGMAHLKGLKNLRVLNISLCKQITDAGIGHLKSLTRLEELDFFAGVNLTDLAMQHLSTLPKLEHLFFVGCHGITDAGMAAIKDMKQMRSLYLSECKITDAGMEHLQGLTQMRNLSLYRTSVTDAGLVFLKDMTQMRNLSLSEHTTGSGLAHLGGMQHLHTLSFIGDDELTDAGLAHIRQFPRLRSLYLSHCKKITDAGLAHLESLPMLETLWLGGNPQITDAGMKHLATNKKLYDINLENCDAVTDAGLAHLSGMENLMALNLKGCDGITDAGLEHLKNLPRLRNLDLSYCKKVTQRAAEALFAAKPECYITGPDGRRLGEDAMRAEFMKSLQKMLTKKSPPNVIIIFTDDQGYSDVGVFGAEGFKTPNLDTLAAEGGVYTNFYVAANACSPSRAALMTGCYPHRVSLPHVLFPTRGANAGPGKDGLHPDEITMAELLKPAGYATACVGKWHLGNAAPFLPVRQGFDTYFGLPYSNDMQRVAGRMDYPPLPLMENETTLETQPDQRFLTQRYTEKAVSFIRENKDKPFFLYLAHSMPHAPLAVSPDFAGKSELGIYGDVIQEIDWSVGEIMKTLDELDLADNTLVVFTSDNGPWLSYGEEAGHCVPLRQGKGTCYEGGHRVPCVMRWPGTIPQGTISGEIITSMDLYPTVARLAGVKLPDDRKIDGVDVTDFLSGKEKSPRDTYFYELSAVRHGDWKLYAPGNYREYPPEDLERKSKTGTRRYINVKHDNYRLYNLADDISETRDLYAQQPEIAEKLTTLLESHRRDMRQNARPLGKQPPGT